MSSTPRSCRAEPPERELRETYVFRWYVGGRKVASTVLRVVDG